MWSQMVEKLLYLASNYLEKNIAKKYQKQNIISIIWPKPAILPNFLDFVLTVSFLQSSIVVLITRPSTVCKTL